MEVVDVEKSVADRNSGTIRHVLTMYRRIIFLLSMN
jgi:hypothetical protein